MEKSMTTQRREELYQILHQMRKKVIVDIEQQLGRELDPSMTRKIDAAMDNGDWAAFEHNAGIGYKLLEMRYKTYKEIADAFRRLEAGTYGICERCGSDIPVDRLKVEPFARYCVPCLTQIEALEEVEKKEEEPPSL